jgi:thiol-disulfide isomerase/thioredoxin
MAARSKPVSKALSLALFFILITCLPSYPKEEAGNPEKLLGLGVELMKEPTPAPHFRLPSIRGGEVSLGSFKDRIVMVHFWATWSPSAQADLMSLEKIQKALAGESFSLITIATDVVGGAQVKAFLAKHASSVPVLIDSQGVTLKGYDVKVVPTTVFIDWHGRVIGRAVGPRHWGESSAVKAFKKMVKAPRHYGIITSGLPVEPAERSR